jgi:predicted RNase H-like HicB family nuclease
MKQGRNVKAERAWRKISCGRFPSLAGARQALGLLVALQLNRGRLTLMKLTAVFEPAEEGGYVCWLEEMPGVQSQGESLEEAKTNLVDALKVSLEYLHERARTTASAKAVRQILEFAL